MLADEPHRKAALLKDGYTVYDGAGYLIARSLDATECIQCQDANQSGTRCPLCRLHVGDLPPPGRWVQCPMGERSEVYRIEVHGKTFGWMRRGKTK